MQTIMTYLRNKKLRMNAKLALGMSTMFASSLGNELPILRTLLKTYDDTNTCQFYMTIAGVQAAINSLQIKISAKDLKRFEEAVRDKLGLWNSQAVDALSELNEFVRKKTQNGVDYPDSLGLWVLWNLKRAQLSSSESEVAASVGNYFIERFQNWWRDSQRNSSIAPQRTGVA